jgi:sarcosine oxidase gamma subunit
MFQTEPTINQQFAGIEVCLLAVRITGTSAAELLTDGCAGDSSSSKIC